MSYTFSFNASLDSSAADNTLSTTHSYGLSAQASDLVRSTAIIVPTNSEVTINLPGSNQLQSVLITAEQDFDVALMDDTQPAPIYTGIFGNAYMRLFKGGSLYDRVTIKAGPTEDVTAQVTIATLSST